MTFSQRNHKRMITRMEPEDGPPLGAFIMPEPRHEESPVDFTFAPLADPDRLKLAHAALSGFNRDKNKRLLEAKWRRK